MKKLVLALKVIQDGMRQKECWRGYQGFGQPLQEPRRKWGFFGDSGRRLWETPPKHSLKKRRGRRREAEDLLMQTVREKGADADLISDQCK